MVKLSIVIPAYNAEKYLGKCLDHILRQTYDNFEIIVVNDASEDCTQNIIESYASQYSMITGVKNEVNQGPAASRQRGMETATGKYITFVDADDWYSRNDSIELIMREIERNQVDCLMYGYTARHIHGIMIPHNLPNKIRGKFDAGALIEIKEKIQAPAFHYVWNKVYNLISDAQLLDFIIKLILQQSPSYHKKLFVFMPDLCKNIQHLQRMFFRLHSRYKADYQIIFLKSPFFRISFRSYFS